MPAIELQDEDQLAIVTIEHAGKFNAMTRAMWRQLRAVFEEIQAGAWRCALLRGAGGHFCSGGDIAEYPAFRFAEASLRAFHEDDVWGGLAAMLECDVPIVAAIEGNCMGAGVELACCCDIRVAAADARFGAPIAKLGFPMAPREMQLVQRAAGDAAVRDMLLAAAVLPAERMHALGFVQRLLPAGEVEQAARALAARVAALAPQAARLNKRMLRAAAAAAQALDTAGAYGWAASAEHMEGIQAFLQKRAPQF